MLGHAAVRVVIALRGSQSDGQGSLWLADPPLGDHNPPPGWNENVTMGVLLKTGPGRAVFKGDGGQRASFQRAPRGAQDPNAGCE
jgi:hypothetical protein